MEKLNYLSHNNLNIISDKCTNKKIDIIAFFILSFILFFYIYSVSFPILPNSFLSRRISALILFISAIIKSGGVIKLSPTKASKEYKRFVKLQIFLLLVGVISLVFIGSGSGRNIISGYLETIIFGTMAFYGITHLFGSTEGFMKSLLLVTIVQCIIIFIGTISSNFQSVLINFTNSQIWDLEHMTNYGYAIGFGCITSSGVFKLSLGIIATIYLLTKTKKNIVLYIFFFIFISIAMIAVARTGFVLMIFGLIAILLILIKSNPIKAFQLTGAILFIALFAFFLFAITGISSYFETIFKRLLNTINNNSWSQFFDLYIGSETTIIPKIGFFGELVVSGTSGLGNQINVDGGFIKVFFAMGIPLAIVFYFSVAYLSLSTKKRNYSFDSCIIILLFVVVLFLGEFKEFFIEDVYFFVILMCFKHFIDVEKKIGNKQIDRKCLYERPQS